ncbi:ethanolamine-phosphate cytidylyltransferase/MUQ1 [Blumeria hordei DH14]|uniref:ethanolamine-phosphate cytidylyltransferase n=1 Tax=Blumeria graminis f. sp. hordei (strain DH14) TaxID=546991 RepID=N1JCX9_BLUG1|nr:ethanolamine-phosphate cytidylyltransferase/MUQ1 [Blumeria hordei DH14]
MLLPPTMTGESQDPDIGPFGDPAAEILAGRIWVDGCWDFFHYGHAGAMLQARQLGTELYVGIHSDESILENKGPTVMTLEERIAAVDACRWVTRSVPHAPYVTSLPWISHYGCKYVVHGDDITSDSNGEDCYRYVKAAGRFKVVKRTPGISTTDLVGRMLLCTRTHFMKPLATIFDEQDSPESTEKADSLLLQIRSFAQDETGLSAGVSAWMWSDPLQATKGLPEQQDIVFRLLVPGSSPKPGQRIVYVDGGFDLFSSGQIEFLRLVVQTEQENAKQRGWFSEVEVQERIRQHGSDYGPVFIVAGIHDDEVINYWKGLNYPIMNILERGLCVLQCKYVDLVIFGAPFAPTRDYLTKCPWGSPDAVYHGPTSFIPLNFDPYSDAKEMEIYHEIGPHPFSQVNAGEIVQRILRSRCLYEERQRIKNAKGIIEKASLHREKAEESNSERRENH